MVQDGLKTRRGQDFQNFSWFLFMPLSSVEITWKTKRRDFVSLSFRFFFFPRTQLGQVFAWLLSWPSQGLTRWHLESYINYLVSPTSWLLFFVSKCYNTSWIIDVNSISFQLKWLKPTAPVLQQKKRIGAQKISLWILVHTCQNSFFVWNIRFRPVCPNHSEWLFALGFLAFFFIKKENRGEIEIISFL